VRRVCLTSSVVAIISKAPGDMPELSDESHWSDVDYPEINAYEKSKTLAERAAWDFVDKLPEHEKFELSTVNPCLVFGPTLVKTDFSSGKIMNMFMQGQIPCGVPLMSFSLVDVRDVAQAHLNCL